MGLRFSDLSVSKRIKIWLIINDLSQIDLAKRLGVSRVHLWKVLKGYRPATDEFREWFWVHVGIPPQDWDEHTSGEGKK